MFQVKCLESNTKKISGLSSTFCLEPLSTGQGITIGNALRRMLLSCIPGIAIVGARILNVDHEFSVIPGVKEDVLMILLNLKVLKFKGQINQQTIIRLNFQGPGIVTANDLELTPNISLVDPQQYIATVNDSTILEMELLLDAGEGYKLRSSENLSNNSRGFLTLDSVFIPVKKVNFFVETLNDEASVNSERLILEVVTDHTVTPEEALTIAAKKLSTIFSLIKLTDINEVVASIEATPILNKKSNLENTLIEELELSVRAYNCLKRANIHTLGDLTKYSKNKLLEFKNFGQRSADEVCETLKERFDLTLA
jgi:DNA-directed RNA polymerase subunit alpha